MGKRRVSAVDNPSKDREDAWKKIFKTLVDLIEDQQQKLEFLVKEQESLEKIIQLQHDKWGIHVKLLEDDIFQMKRDSNFKDMVRFVDAAKSNLIITMKQREAITNIRKFEEADDERSDLKLLFDEVSHLLAERNRVTRSNGKDVDESSMKAERDFAWNQFKKTDKKLQELIKKTKTEVETADNKVQKLIADLEQSQSLNMEKDGTISALQDDIVLLESDSRKKTEEISRLTKELELLRGDSNRSITPVLRRCMVESKNREGGSNDSSTITPVLRRCMVESKNRKGGSNDSSTLAIIDEGGRSSKRKAIETKPRLFTSKFKFPKLKP